MASREARAHWSVFDGVKFLPGKPDALMAEINSAISAIEYARATALLNPTTPSSSSSSTPKNKSPVRNPLASSMYNARISEEAYRMGCVALAEGKLDEALHSFKTSLSKCPPDKSDAVSKIQSRIYITSQKLHKSLK